MLSTAESMHSWHSDSVMVARQRARAVTGCVEFEAEILVKLKPVWALLF